ncbi:alpha/beta hydrolase-fold protein [Modestobacter sp. NPDC049651]|uniref:alpha/beta hydrolase n=1 Tax=unclassified Modestobacter TaxID=2643866 RepID=UPI003401C2A6
MLALAGTVRAFVRHRGLLLRLTGVLVTLVLLLASAAAAVNAHYGYYPTLGQALGRTSPDASSLEAAEDRRGRVPDHGSVVAVQLPAPRSGFDARPAQVYLPPAWFARDRPTLPVVMLLHGTPGSPTDWVEGGEAPATADAWAARHGGRAPVLVMPDVNGTLTGDTECVDSDRGRVETYLTEDVPAAVVAMTGAQPPGRRWAVAGLSEGGTCAMVLALRHPDLFTAFGQYSGLVGPRAGDTNSGVAETVAELFGGSEAAFRAHEPPDLLAAAGDRYRHLGGWFEVGADDAEPLAAAEQLAPLARQAQIDTCLVVVPGGQHTFAVWRAAFRSSLPFLAARLGMVRQTAAMTGSCAAPS